MNGLPRTWVALTATAAIAVLAGMEVVALADDDDGQSVRHHSLRVGSRSPFHIPVVVHTTMTIGYSVKHRPIRAIVVGDPSAPRSMLVVGCIHGNERAGIAIARQLASGPPIAGAALWVIPDLNPDGAAARSRQNADLVDLNRNFPFRWRRLGAPGYQQYSGPRPLSEPEARAARKLILRIKPRITIWFHQALGVVDLSGGDPSIERAYARAVGLPTLRLTRYPGSAVGWGNSVDPSSTAFVVELRAGQLAPPEVARYAAAARRLATHPGT